MTLLLPFFTIITATYNAATTLPPLLESLSCQTCQDFIWIVQDGGSIDGTLALIEEWRDRLPVVDVASEPDSGIYDAWNKALERTAGQLGQWVLFLGADDLLAGPNVLEQVRGLSEHLPAGILYLSAAANMMGVAKEYLPGRNEGVYDSLRWEMPFCHTALFHRSILFNNHRFDARYRVLGDYDFVCRSLRGDHQVSSISVVTTHMRRGGLSTTLCMQPAIFCEAWLIAWRNFRGFKLHHLRVGAKVAIVALLCRLLGGVGAAHAVDRVRSLRGKQPCWVVPNDSSLGEKLIISSECAIVLVNYNNAVDTLACLAALQKLKGQPAYIVVVDNGSGGEDLATLRRGWPRLEFVTDDQRNISFAERDSLPRYLLLSLPENAGFAGGNNAALRLLLSHTDCLAFWMLNSDTEPESHALKQLCARLNEHPDAGLCGSTLLYAHAPETVQAAGGSTLSLWTGASQFLCGGMGRTTVENCTTQDVRRTENNMDYVVGASCLVRREVFEKVGLLPEKYFLYYEDAAFSLSAARVGFALAWASDSVVMHKEGGSTQASGGRAGAAPVRPAYVDYLTVRNRVALVRQYNPWALPVLLASLVGVCANRVRRRQANRLCLILRAAWHGLTGRMGPPRNCGVQRQP